MSNAFEGLGKMVPGFDFLQSLMKNANAAMPHFNQWVAPTIDPAELEKRIGELRTVQFWLEQNARMIGTTIQAMEVQRMTLSTLQTMNVPLDSLREAMTARPQANWVPQAAPRPAAAPEPERASAADDEPAAPTAVVDPMQWWGALSQQFSALAAQALQDPGTQAATRLAGDLVKQSISTAEEAMRQGLAATMPAPAAEAPSADEPAASAAPRKRAAAPRKSAATKSAARTPKK